METVIAAILIFILIIAICVATRSLVFKEQFTGVVYLKTDVQNPFWNDKLFALINRTGESDEQYRKQMMSTFSYLNISQLTSANDLLVAEFTSNRQRAVNPDIFVVVDNATMVCDTRLQNPMVRRIYSATINNHPSCVLQIIVGDEDDNTRNARGNLITLLEALRPTSYQYPPPTPPTNQKTNEPTMAQALAQMMGEAKEITAKPTRAYPPTEGNISYLPTRTNNQNQLSAFSILPITTPSIKASGKPGKTVYNPEYGTGTYMIEIKTAKATSENLNHALLSRGRTIIQARTSIITIIVSLPYSIVPQSLQIEFTPPRYVDDKTVARSNAPISYDIFGSNNRNNFVFLATVPKVQEIKDTTITTPINTIKQGTNLYTAYKDYKIMFELPKNTSSSTQYLEIQSIRILGVE